MFKLNKRNNFSLKREVILNIFLVYLLCLVGVTLFPFMISFDKSHMVSINLTPIVNTIKDITSTVSDPNMWGFMIGVWIKNIGGNLILLLPLGMIMPMLWSKFMSVSKITFFAFSVSLSIEILQVLSAYIGNMGRAFDIDDILFNTIGAFVGYIIYKKVIKNEKFLFNKYFENI